MRYSNFHTTALCSPTRASLLTGRNATSNGMATIAEFGSGFPGISTRIPFENGFISEVLAEQGYNTYCVGKWHLTPGDETTLASYKGRWPLGRGFERFYGFLGGESNSWYPDLVYDNHQIDPPATPEEGYHLSRGPLRQGDRVHPRRQGDRPRQAVLHVPRLAGRRTLRTTSSRSGPTSTRAGSTRAMRRSGAEILERQKELGLLPDGHRALADQPARRAGRHRPRRTALAAARHRSALGLAQRRRAAAVLPHGRGLRRLSLLHRRPARPGPRLPRGVRPARQHA